MRGTKVSVFTPRHLRRGSVDRSGPGDKAKQMGFRNAKRKSDRFIHQSASSLEGNKHYEVYCEITRRDGKALRNGG